MQYLCSNKDDSPLYLFHNCDSDKELKRKYNIPKLFREDYFSILKSKVRPPYRWLLIGPRRSGTKVHIDPMNTSAWNISLQGYKLWVIFPNEVPKWVIQGKHIGELRGTPNEAMDFFFRRLPKVLKKEGISAKPLICIQEPGETIFVPGGWWHAVLNITDTLAITQNYMNAVNFDLVWGSLRIERKMLAEFFVRTMKKKSPSLYSRIRHVNVRDRFVMKTVHTKSS
jgi:histone arginine demethylase JMJD6